MVAMSALKNLSEAQDADAFATIPQGLNELMIDNNEAHLFDYFRSTSAKALHPGFSHESLYDQQRAAYRPLPAKQVKYHVHIAVFANILALVFSNWQLKRHSKRMSSLMT